MYLSLYIYILKKSRCMIYSDNYRLIICDVEYFFKY